MPIIVDTDSLTNCMFDGNCAFLAHYSKNYMYLFVVSFGIVKVTLVGVIKC